MTNAWETIIGLEIHAQLSTESKIFCGCSTRFGDDPNENTCPVCLGLPGALPVLNRRVIELGARAALSLGLQINNQSIFSRKNYFYPDLPKGYQISQYDRPFSANGELEIMTAERDEAGHPVEWRVKKIAITRLHLEEDAGKNVHEGLPDVDRYSYIDLNRAGTPLAEIVTEPDFRSSWEAYDYVNHVRRALQWVGASEADMEKGNLRCEANVSVRRIGEEKFGTKVELKNLNSVRFMQRAIEFEISRQISVLESGGRLQQETRLWDERAAETRVMRSKEEAHDYRYFPEPDLPPLIVADEFIERVREAMPELAAATAQRFMNDYGISYEDALQFTATHKIAADFEKLAKVLGGREASKWMKEVVLRQVIRPTSIPSAEALGTPTAVQVVPPTAELSLESFPPAILIDEVIKVDEMVAAGKINRNQAKEILEEVGLTRKSAEQIVGERGFTQISDEGAIDDLIDEVIRNSPRQLESYRSGKETLFGFFVGQVMKASKGKANPKVVNELLKAKLKG
jgi:aspartyl-tRNA(Asn)/glutamyl-tRNA(Gln) amidotransferase subunit B